MKKETLLLIVFCIALPLLLVLLSYKIFFLSADLTSEQQEWIQFFDDKGSIPEGYEENEVSHMKDVKVVMKYADYALYLVLLLCTVILTYYKKKKQMIKKLLKYGSISSIVFVLIVSSGVLLSFTNMFTVFHDIFFPQGNWMFPADSLLIKTFPLSFFKETVERIFLTTFVASTILLIASKTFLCNKNSL